MMRLIIGILFGLSLALLNTACFRAETTEVSIHIPAMESDLDSRIATNAALDEVVGSLGSPKHEYEFDRNKHIVIYHEGRRLMTPLYQAQIVKSLKEVGFDARLEKAAFNPLPARRFSNGEIINSWPDRFSVRISVPEMDTIQESNIVADALAFVRNGGDDPRVAPDPVQRRLNIVYDNVALSLKNIEEAIACTGYTANGVPPKNASNGWNAFAFRP